MEEVIFLFEAAKEQVVLLGTKRLLLILFLKKLK